MSKKDLVDLDLTVSVHIGLKYGDLTPSEEDREMRRLHAETCSQIKDEMEQHVMDTISEALGYDNETLESKITARTLEHHRLAKAEQDGRDLRARQRSGQG